MSDDIKIFLKCTWVMASIACFVLPLLMSPEDGFRQWLVDAQGDMGVGMFFMAFPISILYMLVLAAIFYVLSPSPYDMPSSLYVLLWLGFFLSGYLQWFHLVPHFFNRQKSLTTLGLAQTEFTEKVQRKRRPPRRRKRKPAQLESKPVLQFEPQRRTPLERIINEN